MRHLADSFGKGGIHFAGKVARERMPELYASADIFVNSSVIDNHRAIASIMEELEAIDWYSQRVAATDDAELAAVLAHNRDEEKEHAAMTLEWLRRHDSALDQHLRTYLFTEAPVTEIEAAARQIFPATDVTLIIAPLPRSRIGRTTA